MQGQAVPVLQKIFLFLLLTKRVFVVKNLAFLHPLPFESSGKQLNSTTTLYASIHQKKFYEYETVSIISDDLRGTEPHHRRTSKVGKTI